MWGSQSVIAIPVNYLVRYFLYTLSFFKRIGDFFLAPDQ